MESDVWMELNYGMESGLELELVGKRGEEGHEFWRKAGKENLIKANRQADLRNWGG